MSEILFLLIGFVLGIVFGYRQRARVAAVVDMLTQKGESGS